MFISTQEIVGYTSILLSSSPELCFLSILKLNDDIKVAIIGKVWFLATQNILYLRKKIQVTKGGYHGSTTLFEK